MGLHSTGSTNDGSDGLVVLASEHAVHVEAHWSRRVNAGDDHIVDIAPRSGISVVATVAPSIGWFATTDHDRIDL